VKFEEIDALLKKSLPSKRYAHSARVMREAVSLAGLYRIDEQKARLAGLLHDCGRETPNSAAAARARELGLAVSAIEEAQPVLLHQRIGAAIAREKYHVTDEDVLRAIALHTTGGGGMDDLDSLIFLSDYTEPARAQQGVENVRRLARKNLTEAMLAALRLNMEYLLSERLYIHPACLDCWNYFLHKNKLAGSGS
jgi:predicted HD superfamily hydrolase involved in NAD metabolism